MKTFKVFRHSVNGFEAVKVGFSWPALFLGVIWMIIKKLYGLAGLWFTIIVILALVDSAISDFVKNTTQRTLAILIVVVDRLLWLMIWLLPAFMGNKWREANLKKRGYEFVTTVSAETPEAAIASVSKIEQKEITNS